jgi:hypothetical protein
MPSPKSSTKGSSGKGSPKGKDSLKNKDALSEDEGSSSDDYVEDEEADAEKDWPSMRETESWLLNGSHFSDVTVTCGPRHYKLHKAILARESTFFRYCTYPDIFLDVAKHTTAYNTVP